MLERIPQNITSDNNAFLTKDILEEEMLQAIRILEQDKSLGPNGFSIRFYKHLWGLIKYDLQGMLNYTLQKEESWWSHQLNLFGINSKGDKPFKFFYISANLPLQLFLKDSH
jgi:hypothetical protein